jgi:hypothetical protein
MIVNVNPYDTGFDENSHVMKFAALAREVYTTPAHAPAQRVPSFPTKAAAARGSKMGTPATGRFGEFTPVRRQVTISTGGPGRKYSEAHLEVLEGVYSDVCPPNDHKLKHCSFAQRTKRWETPKMMTMTNRSTHLSTLCSMKLRIFVCRSVS